MLVLTARRPPAQNVSTRRNGPRPTGPRPRHIALRPRRDPRRIGLRPRRNRHETLVLFETVSRPRRLDRDHIPGTAFQEGTDYPIADRFRRDINVKLRSCPFYLQNLAFAFFWKSGLPFEVWETAFCCICSMLAAPLGML